MHRTTRWILVWFFALGMLAGCDRRVEPEGKDAGTETQLERVDAAEAEGGQEKTSVEKRRSAFGLPFPPKVRGVGKQGKSVEVTTGMELDQLGKFFKSRLVDYEILRPTDNKMRVIGLREHMAEIEIHRYGTISILRYFPSRQKPTMADTGTGTEANGGKPDKGPSAGSEGGGSSPSRQLGEPVELRTPDGELLAPGAKWGEPYTPPPGSPLDKPQFEGNFGKPFGQWQAF